MPLLLRCQVSRLTFFRLRALVAKRDWNEIEEIARSKKSPIGWEVSTSRHIPLEGIHITDTYSQPFYNLTLQAGNPRLAALFIPKCTNIEQGESITMYEKCGMRVKAAEEAVKLKDVAAFDKLLEAAGRDTTEGREIERLGASLKR